jgi:hypothetical protein
MDQLPKPEDSQKDLNTNNNLTLAPDSDLMIPAPTTNLSPLESVLPPLPTMEATQTTPDKVSFDPPQSWGTPSTDTAPASPPSYEVAGAVIPAEKTDIRELRSEISPPPEESTGISIIKIFLISLGLILLGILLGVLAANFYQPVSTPATPPTPSAEISPLSTPSSILTPSLKPTPSATPEALLKLNWKTYTTSNFKLFYPTTWTKKTITGGYTLTKGTSVISFSTKISDFECNIPPIQTFSKGSLVWEIQESSPSSQYQLCEVLGSVINPDTLLDTVIFTNPDNIKESLDEFKYIIEKVELTEAIDKLTDKKTLFVCPTTEYIDCMPTVGGPKKTECSTEAMTWYTANCPNFKGGAF